MTKRLLLLNGLSIIGVVCSHAAQWMWVAMFWWTDRYRPVATPNYDALGTVPYYGVVVLQKIGVFSVPAFLFVSGFFVAYASRGSTGSIWKMVWVRLKNLLIPYAIWSIVIFAIGYADGQIYAPLEYARRLLVGEAVSAYYYPILLCQFYLLTPLLIPLARRQPWLLVRGTGAVLLCVIGLFYLRLYSALAGVAAPLLDNIIKLIPTRSFVRFIFFFAAGIVAGFHVQPFKQWIVEHRRMLLLATLVMAPLAVIETELIFHLTGMDWRGGVFTVTGSLYPICFVLWFLGGDDVTSRVWKMIYELGRASFGIFLLHTTVLEVGARMAQKHVPWLLAYPVCLQLMLVVLAIGLPMLAMTAFGKSPLRRYYRYVFG